MFNNYYDVRDWLENFIPETYTKKELGLGRVKYLLKLLGNPQNKFKSIHVAGTSGKGSTAFYLARLLQVAKVPKVPKVRDVREDSVLNTFSTSNTSRTFKVGLHLSPHLVDIRERMMILSSSVIPASSQTRQAKLDLANAGIQKSSDSLIPNQVGNDNTLMSIGRFLRLFNEVGSIVEKIQKTKPELTPSYFEILVAASFKYFADQKVDWAVVEVGLGGRLDATNVLMPEVSVITNVGLDHTDILGKTIEKIAFEKAGVIKEAKVTKVTKGPKEPEVNAKVKFEQRVIPIVTGASGRALDVIKKVAKEKKAPLITLNTQNGSLVMSDEKFSYLSLYNDILRYTGNFITKDVFFLSLASIAQLKIPINEAKIIEAFSVPFPARFEEIAPNVVIDGAHNIDKIKMLVDFVTKSFFARHSRESLSTLSSRPKGGNLDPRISARGGPALGGREDDIDGVFLVVAFKRGKDWKKMLEYLFQNLDIERAIATQFYSVTDTGPPPRKVFDFEARTRRAQTRRATEGQVPFAAVEPEQIKRFMINDLRFKNVNVKCFENSQEAVFEVLQSTSGSSTLVLITGSLYLAGEARTIWHLPEF